MPPQRATHTLEQVRGLSARKDSRRRRRLVRSRAALFPTPAANGRAASPRPARPNVRFRLRVFPAPSEQRHTTTTDRSPRLSHACVPRRRPDAPLNRRPMSAFSAVAPVRRVTQSTWLSPPGPPSPIAFDAKWSSIPTRLDRLFPRLVRNGFSSRARVFFLGPRVARGADTSHPRG